MGHCRKYIYFLGKKTYNFIARINAGLFTSNDKMVGFMAKAYTGTVLLSSNDRLIRSNDKIIVFFLGKAE